MDLEFEVGQGGRAAQPHLTCRPVNVRWASHRAGVYAASTVTSAAVLRPMRRPSDDRLGEARVVDGERNLPEPSGTDTSARTRTCVRSSSCGSQGFPVADKTVLRRVRAVRRCRRARPRGGWRRASTTAEPGLLRSTFPTERRSSGCSRTVLRTCWSCGRRCCRSTFGCNARGSPSRFARGDDRQTTRKRLGARMPQPCPELTAVHGRGRVPEPLPVRGDLCDLAGLRSPRLGTCLNGAGMWVRCAVRRLCTAAPPRSVYVLGRSAKVGRAPPMGQPASTRRGTTKAVWKGKSAGGVVAPQRPPRQHFACVYAELCCSRESHLTRAGSCGDVCVGALHRHVSLASSGARLVAA